ncbi:MAG: hypothetical protein RL033_2 [Pseudomonadota bacterium]
MTKIQGRYALEREIGRGANGSVWSAQDSQLRRRVAVKLVAASVREHPQAAQRFEREAALIAQVRGSHVVHVYDAGIHEERPFIVMELLTGEGLDARLQRHGRLPAAVVANLALEIGRGLTQVHEVGIVHRDLKPANVFLAREGGRELAKLLDFGVATQLALDCGAESDELLGNTAGTPQYMSPEQFAGASPDQSADLWAFAVLLYQLLTGRCPFQGEGFRALRSVVWSGAFAPPSSLLGEELGGRFDAYFAKALAKDVKDRFGSATELVAAFVSVADPPSSRPIKVLFLDDEPDMELLVRQKLRRALHSQRIELFFASNGQEGLTELHGTPDIDVVLTDINMPVMDGLTFLRHVPEVAPLARVVVVSAYNDMSNIRLAMNRGAFDFLGKPIDFEDLETTVYKCAEHVRLLRTAVRSREENAIMRQLIGPVAAERLVGSLRAAQRIDAEQFEASVAFVHLHGFAEVLERESPALSLAQLNEQMEIFICEIVLRGGQICHFEGEAVFALFTGERHLARTLDASLSIRERLQTAASPTDTFRPSWSASAAVACGRITTGSVGSISHGRLAHVALGEPVSLAAQLRALARSGEVLTTDHVGSLLHSYRTELDQSRQVMGSTGPHFVVRVVGTLSDRPRGSDVLTEALSARGLVVDEAE